ncbi:hypothetical protein RRG08_054079 [Elysia crispata]|uniref:Uncharacterized protein n=1 Tax=Elysia crispata TaxID=231223 RepID=A0AAE0ZDQ4_9GAST|nr:hypothetical protein RRG08_054079 [Elysia crispata]
MKYVDLKSIDLYQISLYRMPAYLYRGGFVVSGVMQALMGTLSFCVSRTRCQVQQLSIITLERALQPEEAELWWPLRQSARSNSMIAPELHFTYDTFVITSR